MNPTRKVNKLHIKCSNFYEFLRRGYCDCGEEFLKQLRMEDEKRVNDKLRELEESKLKKIYFSMFGNQEEIRMKTDEELEQELRKGVIEIPVSLFINNFNEISKIPSKDQVQIRKETFEISNKYTVIMIKYEGIARVNVQPPSNYSMTLKILDATTRSLMFKQEVGENENITIKPESGWHSTCINSLIFQTSKF